MKLKSTLKRYPWRRKKRATTSDPDHTQQAGQQAGQLLTSQPHTTDHQPTCKVNPAVYNELVTPKDPDLGLGTPDKSQILVTPREPILGARTTPEQRQILTARAFTQELGRPGNQILYSSPPVILLYPGTDDDDNDEFGEVRQVPVSLYYDTYGNAVEEETLAGVRSNICPHLPEGGQDLARLRSRYWLQEECLGNYQEEKASRDAMGYYWVEKDIWEPQVGEVKGQVMKQAVNNSQEGVITRLNIARPSPVDCDCGWNLRQDEGWGVRRPHYPPSAHYCPLITLDNTTYVAQPHDMLWMCQMYPGVEWTGEGGGQQAGVGTGKPGQCVGMSVPQRTPAPLHSSTRHRKSHYRERNEKKQDKQKKMWQEMKVWCRSDGGVCDTTPTHHTCDVNTKDHLLQQRACGEGGQSPAHHRQRAATLPGHTASTLPGHTADHTLTHIDYDSLRLEWQHLRYDNRHSATHTNRGAPLSVDLLGPHAGPQEARREEWSAAGVPGGRDEGAWPGGPEGWTSGTCRALGQPGAEASVLSRALPRAHVRPGSTVTPSSVHSASSEIYSVINTKSNETSVKVTAGESEPWLEYRHGACESECTCDMPCKVSGIPVYQGRGGEPPRNSRGDVPPATPAGGATGRGRGAGRRASGSRLSSTSTSRSPAQVGRRGSFGAQVSPAGCAGQDSGLVSHPRRASLPGHGGGLTHTTAAEEHARGVSYRARTSPSPSARSPSSGRSPRLGSRAPSPAASRKTPSAVRRREPLVDPRTPPSTPLSRRPPPRALYQVRLSPSPSRRDSPPMHRDKSASKLPVVACKPSKSDTSQISSRVFPPRPSAGRPTIGQRTGNDSVKDRIHDNKGVRQTSIKQDNPTKELTESIGVPDSAEAEENNRTGGDSSVHLSKASPTAVNNDIPDRQNEATWRALAASRTNSSSCLPKTSSQIDKTSGLLRPGSNRLTSSVSRLSSSRRNASDTPKVSDSKLERTLSVSSSHLTPKTSLTRTYSGPKSSLVSGDGASRARIVRRVMSGSRTNLSKKKSNSKTSLVVVRHNLYNRNKSGSKNSLLGSRNNLFRASFDSQRTESTTDSGCNSPLYGSQCSLDGERKKYSSSPCPSLLKKVGSGSLASTVSKSNSDEFNKADSKLTEHNGKSTPVRVNTQTPAITDPDSKAAVRESDANDKDMTIVSKIGKSVVEACGSNSKENKVNIVHAHSLSSSQLLNRMEKSPVSVKRSVSLQLPRGTKPCLPPKPSACNLRASSSSRIACTESIKAPENRQLPGINVSFRSVSTRQLPSCSSDKNIMGSNERHTENRDKKEVTKVSIVAEPKRREEKGIQVEASSSEEDTEEGDYEAEEEEEDHREKSGRAGRQHGQGEGASPVQSQVVYEDNRSIPGPPQPTPFRVRVERDSQSAIDKLRKNTVVHISRDPKMQTIRKIECLNEIEDNRSNEKRANVADEESHLIQRLETSLADIIDSAVLKNLKINGNVLSDQFDAIIATLKKVAASVDSGEPDYPPLNRRNSESGLKVAPKTHFLPPTQKIPLPPSMPKIPLSTSMGKIPLSTSTSKTSLSTSTGKTALGPSTGKTSLSSSMPKTPLSPFTPTIPMSPTSLKISLSPSTPATPATPTSVSSSSSSMSPASPSTPRTPPSKTPLSLFSIIESSSGQARTHQLSQGRKLSLPQESSQDISPTLEELARRHHGNPNHLRVDQDHVDFMDLDQPYVSPAPAGVSTSELVGGAPTPKAYGRKNSTGSLGLNSCTFLQDNSYYSGGPATTTSVTNLNSPGDYSTASESQQSSFRKVHSTSNVNGAPSGGSHRLFQRHLSLCGPDDVCAENRLRKSLSKSRELLSQLENEYKKIKGDENKSTRNSLLIDQSWLDKDFDELLQTLSNDKAIHSDPHEALAFLTNNNANTITSSAASNKGDKWRYSKKDMPPLPQVDSPRARRQQSQSGSEGRHIFSFFQKKGRSQSLSGTEAIKITLPSTPENGPQGAHRRLEAAHGPRRVTYESATLDRPGRTNRSNSIPSAAPQAYAGTALPHELVGIFKQGRSKSLSKPTGKEDQTRDQEEVEEERGEDKVQEDEEEPAKQMRSLSLPKSFLSDKYGLTGFKAALPR
nr:serine/arginine repetitive matrix protein 2-like [Cherax quadricarinatus]